MASNAAAADIVDTAAAGNFNTLVAAVNAAGLVDTLKGPGPFTVFAPIELRASIVIGSGSASFELIRTLVERLRFMITPRWVHTAAQPIAIDDVTEYLLEAITLHVRDSVVVEIGGADVTSYEGIMREYARQRKLRRWFFAVPFLSPGLSSTWLTLIAPIYSSIGRCLIESVRTPSIVHRADARSPFNVQPIGLRQAIGRALAGNEHAPAETRWSDAGCPGMWAASSEPGMDVLRNEQSFSTPQCGGGLRPRAADRRKERVVFREFPVESARIYRSDDRRCRDAPRPDPEVPLPGSTLDFWRVQHYEPARRLQLLAEMRLPGRAWLEFRTEPHSPTKLRQIAYFEPSGFWGLIYWYLLWPVHELIFRQMLRRIAGAAMRARRRMSWRTRQEW